MVIIVGSLYIPNIPLLVGGGPTQDIVIAHSRASSRMYGLGFLGFIGFRGLGFRGLGFRGLGFRGLGV